MYEKITSKLKKGYRLLKNSSKSFRKHPDTVSSTSKKFHHQSSRYSAPLSGEKDGKFPNFEKKSSTEILKDTFSKQAETFPNPKLTATEKRIQTIFDNDLYKNWLRVGLALRGTCDAVAPFVDKVLIDFQLDMKRKYPNCEENNSQHELIRDVLRLNRRPISKGELWKRSDVNKWLGTDEGPWEIARAFVPKGYWSANQISTASSLDVTGLLNLMMAFAPFGNYVSDLQQVHRVIQIRNRTMHNSRLEFTQDEMENCFQGMEELLNDEQLSTHLAEYQQYEDALEEIKKIKTMNFNLTTTIKSSFDVLEDRLAKESDDSIPSPSAMSSNRELLRSLRQVFGSGEVQFSVDTNAVEEKLKGLETLLSNQQALAEEKIGMLYRKTNYLQHQLDRLKSAISTDETAATPSYIGFDDLEENNVHTHSRKRKRGGKKNKNRKTRQWIPQQQRNQGIGRKKCSKLTLNVKRSYSNTRSKRPNKSNHPFSVPNLNPSYVNSFNISRATSENTFLRRDKKPILEAIRSMSSFDGSNETDDPTLTKNEEATSSQNEIDCSQKQTNKAPDSDVPGPSGLQASDRALRKRRSSTSLIPWEATEKKLMKPSASAMNKKGDISEKSDLTKGSGKSAKGGSLSKTGQSDSSGAGSSGEGHFQNILKSVLRQQTKSTAPVFEDKKEGKLYLSTVRFQSKFIIKSKDPQPTAALAETDAAVEALKRLGLQVVEKKNAKPVLNQFCEAAVQTLPNYFSYVVSPTLYLSVVQVHSLFASWASRVKHEGTKDVLTDMRNDVLLQVKVVDSSGCPKDVMEQNCAKLALTDANINLAEILNVKQAAEELCLRQGGTLPIYEMRQRFTNQGGPSKLLMTMTSLAREGFGRQDDAAETDLVDDIVMARSTQPSHTQDRSEDLAAKALLEKLGVVAIEIPPRQILRESAVNWGYHLPQYHTFEVKPSIDMGQVYYAVVSSKAFHKLTESLTAESDGGNTTQEDARESAARKALLMLGYPQTFHKS